QGVGPFEVGTGVFTLFDVAGTPLRAATTRFEIGHRGGPVAGLDSVGAVATVTVAPPAPPALLVRTGDAQGEGKCVLVREINGTATLTPLGECSGSIRGELLTADSHAWHQAYDRVIPPGWLDRTTFATVGLYRVAGGVLDTRTMAFTPLAPLDPPGDELLAYNGLPPVTLSPDESTYVWIALQGTGNEPLLAATRWATGATTPVAIDRSRMRYRDVKEIDPAWMAHHFTWVRDDDGLRLAERPGFTPLPYTGEREINDKGEVASVYLKPGGTALRDAVVDAMVRDFGAERLPDELNGYHRVVRLEGRTLKVANVSGGGFVSIGMDYGAVDSAFMRRLADRLDQLLATGTLDQHFHVDPT
ncbi:MAG TPA: hypothetical protein VFV33_23460, partial [Gemmatimonadaceae bacterium]|nr:hypothetical protein [Gemmatimonadaceae bacterium]